MAGISAIFPQSYQLLFKYLHFESWLKAPARVGLVSEFWLGTQLGLLWTPCAGSVLASILVLAVVNPQPITAFVLLILYGLGAGFPLWRSPMEDVIKKLGLKPRPRRTAFS